MQEIKQDVIVLGAGAAGLMCALEAARRGRSVAVVDHNREPGRKLLVTGGGRCNFTNRGAAPEHYQSLNPRFCASALQRFTPQHMLDRLAEYRIPVHEKVAGQMFCDRSARHLVDALVREIRQQGAQLYLGRRIHAVDRSDVFVVRGEDAVFSAPQLVVATGGLSYPKLGASGLGYRVAERFGLKIVDTAPALDGLRWNDSDKARFRGLAGIAVPARLQCGEHVFADQVLFTHQGLSGPAALQISLYWQRGEAILIDYLPEIDLLSAFGQIRKEGKRCGVATALARFRPKRLSETFVEHFYAGAPHVHDAKNSHLQKLAQALKQHRFMPAGTVGYQQAEVTRGGIDTRGLSSKTMAAQSVPGLYCIGEVVDVTGQLGGFNLQWAWSSGWAAGQAV